MIPKISVIIPVFNHAEALKACLRSLERQTLQEFEIIIVDDGSDRPVMNATARFEKKRGAPAARNEGFRHARGELVIFLDADAVLRPDALEKMKAALDAHPAAAFAYASFKFGFKKFSSFPFDAELLKRTSYIHTSALIRRAAFPGFDESLKKFQDWDLFLTMAEQGNGGVWINQVLFELKTNGTMSQWLPSITHFLPWPVFGWMPKSVAKYRAAEAIIRAKHHLPTSSPEFTAAFWLGLIVLLEILSIPAAFNPTLNSIFAILVGVFVLVLTIPSPVSGFSILILELLIGSKGRLLVLGANAANDGGAALRIIIFAAFVLGWIVSLIRERRAPDFASFKKERLPWIVLGGVAAIGIIQGWIRGHAALLSDANAWGFWFLLIPALDLAQRHGKAVWSSLRKIAGVGLAWITVKTLALFYFFSHDFRWWWEPVYFWIRRTGVGEVTLITPASSAYRVFFQSHVYPALMSVAMMAGLARRPPRSISSEALKAMALLFAVALISFSRSFWVGMLAGCFFIALDIVRRKGWVVIPRFALAGAGGLLIMFALFSFPFPPSYGNFADLFLARAASGESAAQSRWELLPVLNTKILEAPVFGHGFGATVTYTSLDPRVVETTGGSYTTYAFEWGWHDLAVKLGFVGVIVYLWAIASLLQRLGPERRPWQVAIIALCGIHIFTPYLNHPLGIAVLVLAEMAASSTPKNPGGTIEPV